MHINDLEQELKDNGVNGIDICMIKRLLLLYADNIVLLVNTPDELHKSLNILDEYLLWCVRPNRLSRTKVHYYCQLKIVHTDERKYIKCTYTMMLNDIELNPNKHNWASLVKHLLSRLGF